MPSESAPLGLGELVGTTNSVPTMRPLTSEAELSVATAW